MSLATDGKAHLSVVICGHVDSGKSTTTGRLIFELGGIPERELEKLKEEAARLGKSSFAFAFYMDTQKEERARGVTIACTTKEFYTNTYHYTIIDAPGHRDFIKNMISGRDSTELENQASSGGGLARVDVSADHDLHRAAFIMANATDGKAHLSVVICGHVDSGKSTTTGRLIFELGGIPERELEKLKEEAARLGKSSFAFAFYMDTQKEERARGVTIACTTKEFYTNTYHYTIIDAPGHRDFIKNMISGAAQADVCLLMVPADGNFTTAIQKGDHKAGEVQGQTRQHARLINLLGVKQLIIGINKMDCDTAGYKHERYTEIANEMKHMLVRVGWKDSFVEKSVPIVPISGWMGDNLIKPSENMKWWTGCDVDTPKGKVHVHTLLDALNDMAIIPERKTDVPLRLPISGAYKIKGVGDVLAGRVEQGVVKPGDEVVFLPTHTTANPCFGKVFTVEMHHKRVDKAGPGDNVGMNIKGLDKGNMPRTGDVMILKSDQTLKPVSDFTAQIQTLDIPGEVKGGYSPIGFVRCGRSACRIKNINWKVGKETGGKKAENPHSLKANEMAEVVFEPMQPLIVDSYKNCEGLSRIAFLDGNTAVMLGKVVSCNAK
eukprot:CAMPEP_0119115718 /NCGR_PEP_ID=MMETSP1180-20130426/51890_1 /TAXON_ID=3052 ORGANISM="Chlamydomonas cf sp, Strain CCMP681" /NCGR_SAMPLE_ID=MMETSP1180 /ASSEMBLY_ACC=CAM_ASM_000741 /LENGTH=606 /DNA_ID=CAMNT_0007104807 /DNA_START=108 /DNA_END=1928 /DNA_ORIENTATION=-